MARKSDIVNVAVIGLGMGRGHLRDYAANPKARPVALCDVNAERVEAAAKEHNVPADRCYTDYRKLLGDAKKLELEAVSVALPNSLHAPVTVAGLRAGMHVLCEKPMAMTASQAKQMLAAAKAAKRKLMINFSFRFNPCSMSLKRFVDAGHIGNVYYGRTVWHRRRGLPGFGGWFGTKALSGGGPIIDLGVHRLDLAMWLMGNPRPVTVSASTFNVIGARLAVEQKKTFDVEDLGAALIRFDNGATVVLEASWAGFTEKRENMVTELWGTTGGVIQRNVGEGYEFEALALSEEAGSLWKRQLQQPVDACPSSYTEFIAAILEDRDPIATGQHGLDVQQILDAVYKSAATGKEIRIR